MEYLLEDKVSTIIQNYGNVPIVDKGKYLNIIKFV